MVYPASGKIVPAAAANRIVGFAECLPGNVADGQGKPDASFHCASAEQLQLHFMDFFFLSDYQHILYDMFRLRYVCILLYNKTHDRISREKHNGK